MVEKAQKIHTTHLFNYVLVHLWVFIVQFQKVLYLAGNEESCCSFSNLFPLDGM